MRSFDTGDGHLTLTCHGSPPGSEVRISPSPRGEVFLSLIAFGILLPLGLGGAGLLVLLVTTVLWLSGTPRTRPAS